MVAASSRRVCAIVLTVLVGACSSDRGVSPPCWAACHVGTDARATCYSQQLILPDDKRYALDHCRSGNGILKEARPGANLVGSCASTGKVRTSKGYEPRALLRYD